MPDDKELFEDAMTARDGKPETPEPPEQVETPAEPEQPEAEEQPEKAEAVENQPEPPEGEEPEQPETPEQPEKDHRVPLSELLNTRERAQKAEAERERIQRENEEYRRRLDALEKAGREPKEKPDIWADPEAYVNSALNPVNQGLQDAKLEMSEVFAVDKYGEESVQKALQALDEHVRSNPLGRFEHQRIMAAKHPYGEMVKWHQQSETMKEVGADPKAYREKLQQQMLDDPEFRKQAMEHWRASAQQNTQSERSPTTQLPPSLARTPASKDTPDAPVDEASLLDDALKARTR